LEFLVINSTQRKLIGYVIEIEGKTGDFLKVGKTIYLNREGYPTIKFDIVWRKGLILKNSNNTIEMKKI